MFRKDDALGPSVNNPMGGLRMSTLQLQTGGQIIAKSPGPNMQRVCINN